MVHLRLKLGNNSVRTNALVDSGATTTFIPIDFMMMLGSSLRPEGDEQDSGQEDKTTIEAVGAGGTFKGYEATLDSIGLIKGTQVFCELKDWPVLVPTTSWAIPYVILGRDGVFRKYDITYREHKEQLLFRRAKR